MNNVPLYVFPLLKPLIAICINDSASLNTSKAAPSVLTSVGRFKNLLSFVVNLMDGNQGKTLSAKHAAFGNVWVAETWSALNKQVRVDVPL